MSLEIFSEICLEIRSHKYNITTQLFAIFYWIFVSKFFKFYAIFVDTFLFVACIIVVTLSILVFSFWYIYRPQQSFELLAELSKVEIFKSPLSAFKGPGSFLCFSFEIQMSIQVNL